MTRPFELRDSTDNTDRIRVKPIATLGTKAGDYSGRFMLQIGNSHMALLNKAAAHDLRDQLNDFWRRDMKLVVVDRKRLAQVLGRAAILVAFIAGFLVGRW